MHAPLPARMKKRWGGRIQSRRLFWGGIWSGCGTRGSERTIFCTKQTLCSWRRHGYRSSKNINSDNKRPDGRAASTDVPSRSQRSSHSCVREAAASATAGFLFCFLQLRLGDSVKVVESNSTRMLKVGNQKDNEEFYLPWRKLFYSNLHKLRKQPSQSRGHEQELKRERTHTGHY